jgi:hypothetical protein
LLEIIRCRHGERLSQSHYAHCVRGKCLRRVVPASLRAASRFFNDLREFAPTGAHGRKPRQLEANIAGNPVFVRGYRQ